jgi:hypothetical protein
MKLQCNTHAASFVKGGEVNEWDNVEGLQPALRLSGEFAFKYTYPLSHAAHFRHTLTPDMTGEDLLVLARGDYEQIYREEEAAAGNPGHIAGMLNRGSSAGPYGIWGHDFSDLYFESVEIDTADCLVEFGMGS